MLADQHIHSCCSEDADDTMLDMAAAAAKYGVTDLCFTDHCDLDDPFRAVLVPNYADVWTHTKAMYLASVEKSSVRIRLGLELGAANHHPGEARRMASMPELDLVMGSIHNLRDTPDFYYLKYESEKQCVDLLDQYADELLELSKMDCFDVMSHIGYTRRYMQRDGFNVAFDLAHFGDKIETILKSLIENGHGLEVNCSGPRLDPTPQPTPGLDILRLYRQLGGEIVTVGSDAHRVSAAGVHVAWGHEQLRAAGFRRAALFEKRRPAFYDL